jgi:YbbR domain-containing protein
VRIWGAKSSVKGIDELLSWPIDLGSLEKDSRVEVAVQKPSQPFLYLDEEKVRVDIPVQELQDRLALGRVDVLVKNCPETLTCTVEPASVQVALTGPQPALLKVKRGVTPVTVTVDAVDFDPTVSRHDGLRPSCERPSGLDCTISPRAVLLTLSMPGRK